VQITPTFGQMMQNNQPFSVARPLAWTPPGRNNYYITPLSTYYYPVQ
jgi:hypothetical protein